LLLFAILNETRGAHGQPKKTRTLSREELAQHSNNSSSRRSHAAAQSQSCSHVYTPGEDFSNLVSNITTTNTGNQKQFIITNMTIADLVHQCHLVLYTQGGATGAQPVPSSTRECHTLHNNDKIKSCNASNLCADRNCARYKARKYKLQGKATSATTLPMPGHNELSTNGKATCAKTMPMPDAKDFSKKTRQDDMCEDNANARHQRSLKKNKARRYVRRQCQCHTPKISQKKQGKTICAKTLRMPDHEDQ